MSTIRLLIWNDYNKGYLDLLRQLTTVGDISYDKFKLFFSEINTSYYHYIYVIEKDNKIIASITLLIEQKIIHNCGYVAHIEDVVVDEQHRCRGYAKELIDHVINKSKEVGCYKIILDGARKVVSFYEKAGFIEKEVQMVMYL